MAFIRTGLSFLCIILAAACGNDDGSGDSTAEETGDATLASDWDARLSAEEIARGRKDESWMLAVQLDSADIAGDSTANGETWEQISAQSVNTGATVIPVRGDVSGPSVLRVQILLDRVLFSPGIIDGHWGKNTAKALYWFQRQQGLRATGVADEQTFNRLVERGGQEVLIEERNLTSEDVAGPFVHVPEDIYEKAELDCVCYESLGEKLTETFHVTREVLQQLNPGTVIDSLSAGNSLMVPAVRPNNVASRAAIATLRVSADGFYVHALDAQGQILFHFPSTLGSTYDPSPVGSHTVTSITRDPWWHYQPKLLAHIDDEEPDARIPPGANSAVGLVWMALSIPHYGIHGTSAPETIGYTTSAGCVRLTNWDALFLAGQLAAGTPVEFDQPAGANDQEGGV